MKVARRAALLSLMLTALLGSGPTASAGSFSFTGNFVNDNDVQFFNFSVGATSTVTLRSYSYAGGTNAAGTAIARGGFDPILSLFTAAGALIGQNDDGGPGFVPADAVTGQFYDTFFQATIGAGNYIAAVMQYNNFANGPNLSDGFLQGGNTGFSAGFGCAAGIFCDVTTDSRDSHWAFDILNVESAEATPLPAALPLFASALGIGGFVLRRRRRRAATA